MYEVGALVHIRQEARDSWTRLEAVDGEDGKPSI